MTSGTRANVWYKGKRDKLYPGFPDTPENRERCERMAKLIAAEIELGIFDIEKYRTTLGQRRRRSPAIASTPGYLTVQAFGEGPWYERKKAKSETKAKEYLGDLRIISSIEIGEKKSFGAIKLRDLKPEHIDQLTNELKKRQGRKRDVVGGTRLNTLLHKVTRSILLLAYERGYMTKNPQGWFQSQREEKPDIDPFSFDEMLVFLDTLPEPRWKRYFTVAFGTGMNPSEQFALEWQHIDFKANLIYVRQGFVKGRLTILKTESRNRDIEMFPHVEQALRERWEATQGASQHAFPNSDGGPLHLDNLRNRIWNPTLQRAGLRPRSPYQTRHSYASQLLSKGADLAWVARMMGHANTKMLVLRYWKFIRNRTQPDGGFYLEALQQATEGRQHENRP